MQKLSEAELDQALSGATLEQGTPLLGICLGAQLFFDSGEEGTRTRGLGLVPGSVRALKTDSSRGMRVPHTGWNSVSLTDDWAKAMTTDSVDLYFNHGFVVEPTNTSIVRAFCDYSERFVAGYQYQNMWGFQFHPEKSQKQGLRLLQYFLDST
jgi:glutamine amidotransferase